MPHLRDLSVLRRFNGFIHLFIQAGLTKGRDRHANRHIEIDFSGAAQGAQ